MGLPRMLPVLQAAIRARLTDMLDAYVDTVLTPILTSIGASVSNTSSTSNSSSSKDKDGSHAKDGVKGEEEVVKTNKDTSAFAPSKTRSSSVIAPSSTSSSSSTSSTSPSSTPTAQLSTQAMSQLHVLAAVCVEFCLSIHRCDVLFSVIYPKFRSLPGGDAIFLQLLEPFIVTGRLTTLSPAVLQAFVWHFVRLGRLADLEKCLLRLTMPESDMPLLLQLCREYRLLTALIVTHNQGMGDYGSPLNDMANLIMVSTPPLPPTPPHYPTPARTPPSLSLSHLCYIFSFFLLSLCYLFISRI
jgi:hypothetical protein